MVFNPSALPPEKEIPSFWDLYFWHFTIGMCGLAVMIAGFGYAIIRLNRYRNKWKEVKKRMEGAAGDGLELAAFDGVGRGRDDSFNMANNPMMMQDQGPSQEEIDAKIKQAVEAEKGKSAEEVNALQSQKDQLMREMARLKREAQRNKDRGKKTKKTKRKAKKSEFAQVKVGGEGEDPEEATDGRTTWVELKDPKTGRNY